MRRGGRRLAVAGVKGGDSPFLEGLTARDQRWIPASAGMTVWWLTVAIFAAVTLPMMFRGLVV